MRRNCPDRYGGIETFWWRRRQAATDALVGTALIGMEGLRLLVGAVEAHEVVEVGTALIGREGLRLCLLVPAVDGAVGVGVGTALISREGLPRIAYGDRCPGRFVVRTTLISREGLRLSFRRRRPSKIVKLVGTALISREG